MGWTTPTDRATGYAPSAADWNVIQDDMAFLFGDAAWTNVSGFTNSWVAGGTTPGYILLGRTVCLRGNISTGTAATAAFTLPVGYRPSQQFVFVVWANSGVVVNVVTVNTSGTVVPTNSANTWLDNLMFPNV